MNGAGIRRGDGLRSILVRYDGENLETQEFSGRLRALTWDAEGSRLTLVGNHGRMLTIQRGRQLRLDSGTKDNLRAVSTNIASGTTLAVGNSGTIIAVSAGGSVVKASAPTFENLRAVRWNDQGTAALIAGNNGVLIKYTEDGIGLIDDGTANLRGISWRKGSNCALIVSNCFAEEFIPSPNLFILDGEKNILKPVNEGRSDLIGVDWNPNGTFALVVGYDVVWHTGYIARFDDTRLSPIKFDTDRVYPIDVSWDPTGRMAAIATSTAQLHSGQGRIVLWNGETFREIYRTVQFFFSDLAWAPVGFELAAIASTEARTFDT